MSSHHPASALSVGRLVNRRTAARAECFSASVSTAGGEFTENAAGIMPSPSRLDRDPTSSVRGGIQGSSPAPQSSSPQEQSPACDQPGCAYLLPARLPAYGHVVPGSCNPLPRCALSGSTEGKPCFGLIPGGRGGTVLIASAPGVQDRGAASASPRLVVRLAVSAEAKTQRGRGRIGVHQAASLDARCSRSRPPTNSV